MAAPPGSPPANIDFTSTDEEVIIALNKFTSGSPLPPNVIDANPYIGNPKDLPDDVWFLSSSKEKVDMEYGLWKVKEEVCVVFSNSDSIGWRTTLEYSEGQVHHEHKTDWMMQVFSIIKERLCDDNEKKETSTLCRVFLAPSHEMQQKLSSAATQTPVLDAQSSTGRGSSSNAGVNKHDEKEVLAVAETLPLPEHQGDNNVEMDFFSGGQIDFSSGDDYLELLDLINPASSSSSENSSAPSISSDECFDSMAFLQDLEEPILEQSNADRKLNVSASNKLDEVVMVPATLEPLVSVEGSKSCSHEFLKPTGAATTSASGSSRDLNNKVAKHAKGDQRAEGPSSSSSCKPSTSSESHLAASGGRKRAGFGGMKKLGKKYLCFMPF
ncbi:hypothetical protein DITRI_Ditri10aG0031300 [Diplodiscus trichospermus]